MAKKKTAPAVQQSAEEQKYTVAALRKYSFEVFGVTASTFDGAAGGLTGTYTKTEMEAIIKNWLNKEVEI